MVAVTGIDEGIEEVVTGNVEGIYGISDLYSSLNEYDLI